MIELYSFVYKLNKDTQWSSSFWTSRKLRYFLASGKSTIRSTRSMQPFKLFCNVFCKSTEWYICFTKLYTVVIVASHQIWHNGGVTIYFWIFTMITNASTLLESSFTIYPFLTPRIANALFFILIMYCLLLIIYSEKHLHSSRITSQLHKSFGELLHVYTMKACKGW